ncbi:MAG: cytochrome C oxidase subunit IV family protein [Candidatus Tectomicrobia bacterium]|uniref:Cytochrome C oxidase subunit IV family protein n=1 Tax=Tectimicrobiota bacterium TaxID=2528274 RepID=A0A932GQB0_UNCTE|nr:cytochrome C oxidase subunit IV family protein [Candidatus Tectomicrobia bacterium]
MAEHKDPNYMAIFWWLLALTITELGVIFLPAARWVIVVLLVALALSKASLVAMYFMHLRFERRTLSLIAVTPLLLSVIVLSLVSLDRSPVPRRTVDVVGPAPSGQ